MTTALRRQQRYDHRLRELVRRTGELRLATDRGVPRSTARGWLGASPNAVVGLRWSGPDGVRTSAGDPDAAATRRRSWRPCSGLRLSCDHAASVGSPASVCWTDPPRRGFCARSSRARTCIPLRGILRFLHLSPSRFHAWRRRQRACALDDQAIMSPLVTAATDARRGPARSRTW